MVSPQSKEVASNNRLQILFVALHFKHSFYGSIPTLAKDEFDPWSGAPACITVRELIHPVR